METRSYTNRETQGDTTENWMVGLLAVTSFCQNRAEKALGQRNVKTTSGKANAKLSKTSNDGRREREEPNSAAYKQIGPHNSIFVIHIVVFYRHVLWCRFSRVTGVVHFSAITPAPRPSQNIVIHSRKINHFHFTCEGQQGTKARNATYDIGVIDRV